MANVTRLLDAAASGDGRAAAELLPLVYAELRKLAAAQMARESPGQTLDATALVHEAYVRLVGPNAPDSHLAPRESRGAAIAPRDSRGANYSNRGHFFAAAAEAMRRLLVDRARRKRRVRHGGQLRRVEMPDVPHEPEADRMLALDDALTQLAAEDAIAAKVVELRHFAGLGHEGIAAALGITVYQARQKWEYARAWLRVAIGD